MKLWFYEVAKGITGLVAAGYATFQLATTQGSENGTTVSNNEWVSIIVSAILAGFAVWAIPNQTSTTVKKETSKG